MTDNEEANWTPETNIMRPYLNLDPQYEIIYKDIYGRKIVKVKLKNSVKFVIRHLRIKSTSKLVINRLIRECNITNILGALTDGIVMSEYADKKEVGEYTVIEILMEYGGVPLSTFVEKKELEEGDTMNIACQLLSILTLMEELGISHLDIKLQNIVWNKNQNRVKLIDFGTSLISFGKDNEILKEVDRKEIFGYTKPYSAPEIKKNVPKVIPQKLDVYSFGVTLLKLLASECKIQNLIEYDTDFFIKKLNIDELKEKVKKGHMDNLWEVIYKATESAPQSRPTFRELREDFLKRVKGMTKDDCLLDVIGNLNDHTIKMKLIGNLKLNNIYRDLMHLYGMTENYGMEVKCAEKYLEMYSESEGEGEESLNVAYSYYRLAYFCTLINERGKVISYLEKALGILLKMRKRDSLLLKGVYSSMGMLYGSLDDHKKAKEYYDEVFKIESGESGVEISLLNTISGTYVHRYNYEKTEEVWDKALKKIEREKTVQGGSIKCLPFAFALGLGYYFKGNVKLAREIFNENLNEIQSEHEEEHPYLIYMYLYLGIFNIFAGCPDKAIETLDKGLSISLKLYGEMHADAMPFYTMKAFLYKYKGHYKTSIDLYNKYLSISLQKFGSQNQNTLMLHFCLGDLYCEIGDFIKAELNCLKALDIAVKIFKGENMIHAQIYNILGTLSVVHERNPDKCIHYSNKELNIALKAGYKNSPLLIMTYLNLAMGYFLRGDFQEVIKLCDIGLDIIRRSNRRKGGVFGIFNYVCGVSYSNTGNKKLGIDFIDKGLKAFLDISGSETALASKACYYLKNVHQIKGDRVKILEEFNKSSKILETIETTTLWGKVYAIFHYDILARGYRLKKDLLNAKAAHEQALKISLDGFGELHLSTAVCFYNLGLTYVEFENIKEAEEHFDKALSIQMRISNETHYLTGTIYFNLAIIYRMTGRYEKALNTLGKSVNIFNSYSGDHESVVSLPNKMMQELREIIQRGN